jgi:hypothetical protein
MITLISVLFFVILLVLISQNNSSLSESIDHYCHSASDISRVSSLALSSEILTFRSFPDYPLNDTEYWIATFSRNLPLASDFILLLLGINDPNNKLESILKEDLCKIIDDNSSLKEQCDN